MASTTRATRDFRSSARTSSPAHARALEEPSDDLDERRGLEGLRRRTGSALDVAQWFAPSEDGRVNATIVSVAHLDDEERNLVLGVVLDEVLAWV